MVDQCTMTTVYTWLITVAGYEYSNSAVQRSWHILFVNALQSHSTPEAADNGNYCHDIVITPMCICDAGAYRKSLASDSPANVALCKYALTD